jgi:hypothetical protein
VHYEFAPQGQTIWDVCGMWYEESGLKCGLQEARSFITVMLQLTQCCQIILGKTFSFCLSTAPCSPDLSHSPSIFLFLKL